MATTIHRVVTGKDGSGKAVVVLDDLLTNAFTNKDMGITSTRLWITDSVPADISDNRDAATRQVGVQPPAGGSIFSIIEFAPQESLQSDPETRRQMMKKMGLGPEGELRPNHDIPGMHRTRTLDYVLVLSGEIDLVLDDSEVHLKEGDIVVQKGTNHAWVNRGQEPCRVAVVVLDAKEPRDWD